MPVGPAVGYAVPVGYTPVGNGAVGFGIGPITCGSAGALAHIQGRPSTGPSNEPSEAAATSVMTRLRLRY